MFAKPITGDRFVAVIVVITLLAVAMVLAGVKGGANSRGMFWVMVWVMGGMLANGLHHLLLTLYFCAYTPGVMTSALVFVPCSIYLVRKATSERQLESKRVTWGLGLGVGLMGPVILGSKWLVESLISLA